MNRLQWGLKIQSWRQPAKHATRQARHEQRANVAMRQSPDFRLFPLLPEVLDRLPLREQIMDSFNQKMFSFGMTGVDKIRFNRVVSIASCAGLRAWSVSRTHGQMTERDSVMRTPGTVRTAQAMRASLHAVNPAAQVPKETPRSPTDGQPSSSSQPVSARISATFCAIARANSKQSHSKDWRGRR